MLLENYAVYYFDSEILPVFDRPFICIGFIDFSLMDDREFLSTSIRVITLHFYSHVRIALALAQIMLFAQNRLRHIGNDFGNAY